MTEARPHSAARGYDRAWRKRQAAHLERVRVRQEAEGLPGGPYCECESCGALASHLSRMPLDWGPGQMPHQAMVDLGRGPVGSVQPADTVDHYPRPRRSFPLELQGSEEPGGSDHHSNLRAMSHSHHSRRTEDKARRRPW